MSRRRIVIGIVIAVLAALVANGTTLAVAGPHAVAAKKHHKKKKKKKKQQHNGGAAAGCSGTLSPFENRTWHLVVNCTSGTFSQFTVTTNHVLEASRATGGSCQQTSSSSFSCSGPTVNPNTKVHVFWFATGATFAQGNGQCQVDQGESVSVTIAGKSFGAPVAGC